MAGLGRVKYMVLCNLPYRLRKIAGRVAKKCRRRRDRSLDAKLEDIRNLLIRTLDGKRIRLGDIARVQRTFAEPQRNGFFVNGKSALAICIAMEKSAIVPDVGKAVDARLS